MQSVHPPRAQKYNPTINKNSNFSPQFHRQSIYLSTISTLFLSYYDIFTCFTVAPYTAELPVKLYSFSFSAFTTIDITFCSSLAPRKPLAHIYPYNLFPINPLHRSCFSRFLTYHIFLLLLSSLSYIVTITSIFVYPSMSNIRIHNIYIYIYMPIPTADFHHTPLSTAYLHTKIYKSQPRHINHLCHPLSKHSLLPNSQPLFFCPSLALAQTSIHRCRQRRPNFFCLYCASYLENFKSYHMQLGMYNTHSFFVNASTKRDQSINVRTIAHFGCPFNKALIAHFSGFLFYSIVTIKLLTPRRHVQNVTSISFSLSQSR